MKIKTPVLIAIIVLIILVALAIIFGGYKKPITQKEEEIVIAPEIYGVSGIIEEIKDNALVINALILLADPSKEPIKQNVNVAVDKDTKIVKLEFPDPKTITAGSTKPIYPKETTLKFSDLKKGDKIDIQAKENVSEKIKNKVSFTASIINVAK
ncbi:MAG: hypothetical protein ACOZAL_00305 [Patescibacteria group bacterium]